MSLHLRQLHQHGVWSVGWGWNPPCGAWWLSIICIKRLGCFSPALRSNSFLSSSVISSMNACNIKGSETKQFDNIDNVLKKKPKKPTHISTFAHSLLPQIIRTWKFLCLSWRACAAKSPLWSPLVPEWPPLVPLPDGFLSLSPCLFPFHVALG